MDSVWKILNSPFTLFVLGSIAAANLVKYWEIHQSRRQNARELYKYILECIARVQYVLDNFPQGDRIAMWDWWNVNNALSGGGNNTYYAPLFKEFKEQPIEALLTVLEMSQRKRKERYASLMGTLAQQHRIVDGSEVVEKREEVEAESGSDLEGLAQLWTFWSLGPEKVAELDEIRGAYPTHLEFLMSVKEELDRRL